MAPVPETSPYPMIPMHKALEIIAQTLEPLAPISVPTGEALHHILAAPIHAPSPQPPFRASVKDGYAITLPLHDSQPLSLLDIESVAGSASAPTVSEGQAVYVTTGAPVPHGTDAVVMVEHCIADAPTLTILPDVHPTKGQDIREIGSDVAQGELVLAAGTVLGAAELGILASCGVASVSVHGRPTIGVLSTGNELLDVSDVAGARETDGGRLPFGKIVDSNRPMLLGAVKEALPFCDGVDLGIVGDEVEVVEGALKAGLERCNVVVTSGGVSMGKRDVIKPVLERMARVHFGRVIMKPGKPLTYATVDRTRCVVGLPGNPVSCFVCFHLAVAIAARRLAGWDEGGAQGTVVEASVSADIRLDKQRPEYHRAHLEWRAGEGWIASSTGKQASSRLLSARSADALLALPAGDGVVGRGQRVKAYLLPHLQVSGSMGTKAMQGETES